MHGGKAESIKEVSMDMSPAFISGVKTHLPAASVTFDKFHVVKTINDACQGKVEMSPCWQSRNVPFC